jgi:non-canonical purine NTP pyrophosphatase, rdgB/HAM1 family
MKPRLLLATHNPHKVLEIRDILGKCIEILDFGNFLLSSPEETGKTLWENALIKAKFGYEMTGIPSLGEDTGLFVEALKGAPGIFSSRFAGKGATDKKNREKLLYLMKGEENRKAKFVTVIAYYDGKRMEFFEGVLEGEISREEKGEFGFGYDPIFVPNGYKKTLAEIPMEEKNKLSHRYKAVKKFLKWFVSVL